MASALGGPVSVGETSARPPLPDAPLTAEQLREVALFGALPDAVLERFIGTLAVLPMATGQFVFHEGDAARELFVVLDGEVEVLKRSRNGRETRVAVLGPRDVFGEMSVVDLQPRSASVRALSPGRLIRVTSEDLDGLYRCDLKAYALVVLNIARDLSRRLRVTDSVLADVTANAFDDCATPLTPR
jgi:CRP-like cAMP-binding protein